MKKKWRKWAVLTQKDENVTGKRKLICTQSFLWFREEWDHNGKGSIHRYFGFTVFPPMACSMHWTTNPQDLTTRTQDPGSNFWYCAIHIFTDLKWCRKIEKMRQQENYVEYNSRERELRDLPMFPELEQALLLWQSTNLCDTCGDQGLFFCSQILGLLQSSLKVSMNHVPL